MPYQLQKKIFETDMDFTADEPTNVDLNKSTVNIKDIAFDDNTKKVSDKSFGRTLLGFVVGTFFAVLGSSVWIFVSYLTLQYPYAGSLAYISSLLIIYGSLYGYSLLSADENFLTGIILTFISCFTLFLAEVASFSLIFYFKNVPLKDTLFESVRNYCSVIIKNENYFFAFKKDMIIGTIIILFASVFLLSDFFKFKERKSVI